ncbi:MAG: hypothetical protein L6V88_11085 [Anaerotruncus sp.]|nr:MAG: hypothetical protein L6V88_11085 [Anaerotruncus sp.]
MTAIATASTAAMQAQITILAFLPSDLSRAASPAKKALAAVLKSFGDFFRALFCFALSRFFCVPGDASVL